MHRRAQLIHAADGPLRVITAEGSWSVPADQAVWVPAGLEHAVIARTPLTVHAVFVDPAAAASLPRQCRVLNLTALARALIPRLAGIGEAFPREGPEQRLGAVLLDELARLAPAPLHLPLARDPRVRRVIDRLIEDPADPRGLEAWAAEAGASARTLARAFRRETGLAFGQWRTRLRLIEGVERLQRGHAVTRVALDLGYRSPSAFVAMFHRELGFPPSRLRRVDGRPPPSSP
ncbi:AraC family transcriptional regulator [Endothiovibrio diazotrophicus]